VLAATCSHLPAAGLDGGDTERLAQLDTALAPGTPPAGLADTVLAATRGHLPTAVDNDAPLAAQLDIALAPPPAPAGLADAVLAATRGALPVAAPAGRIGFGRVGWTQALAAAALVAVATGAWWFGSAGGESSVTPSVVTADTLAADTPGTAIPSAQAVAVDAAERGSDSALDAEATRLLQPFESIDNRLAWTASPDEAAANTVGLLGRRLAVVADAGPWASSGFDGIDLAIDWEVSYEAADEAAWLF